MKLSAGRLGIYGVYSLGRGAVSLFIFLVALIIVSIWLIQPTSLEVADGTSLSGLREKRLRSIEKTVRAVSALTNQVSDADLEFLRDMAPNI